MQTTSVRRPRNVGPWRAAAILYGDWGTSKAYVCGLAFAIAAYSSFWLVLAVSVLTAIVGINYIWVCKYYPDGGGVYTSAREHSQILAMVGGLLLVANYIVTAALSAFVAFQYLGFTDAEATRWASVAIFAVGAVNFLGPRHSGGIAIFLGIITAIIVSILALFCIPHLEQGIANLERPQMGMTNLWVAFVGVILALSGVESIANLTGLMKLDPGSTDDKPSVSKTSRRAIFPIMIEVCLLTAFFGLAMLALPKMTAHEFEGNMLRHMAEVFVDNHVAGLPVIGFIGQQHLFSFALSGALALLLLSAANTALIGMVSVVYLMAQDGELPQPFSMLNRNGVPWILLLISIIAPVVTVEIFTAGKGGGILALSELYAIGVVGTIAVNLGSCAINRRLPMPAHERITMAVTGLLMVAIWVTIAITKLDALLFALIIIGIGFGARFAARSSQQGQLQPPTEFALSLPASDHPPATQILLGEKAHVILVATRTPSPVLDFAILQARLQRARLCVLFIRQISVNLPLNPRRMETDPEAMAVFTHVRELAKKLDFQPLYATSDEPAATILDVSASIGADYLIMGGSHRRGLEKILRGDMISAVARDLPENIKLLIYG